MFARQLGGRSALRIGFVASLAASSAVLVGCSGAADATKEIVDAIAAKPPVGYTISVLEKVWPYSPEYWTSLSKPADLTVAEECAAVIEYGQAIGATHWRNDVFDVTIPIEGYEAQSQIACVNTLGGAWDDDGGLEQSAATGFFGLWSEETTLGGNSGVYVYLQVNVGDGMMNMEVYPSVSNTDNRFGPWTWDEALSKLDSGGGLTFTALDPLGEYLGAHPEADPDSLKSVMEAYADVVDNPAMGTIEIVSYSDTSEVFLRVTPFSQSRLPLCVSVAPFDPDYFGVADPGFGYGVGIDEGFRPKHAFASAVTVDCPPVNPSP